MITTYQNLPSGKRIYVASDLHFGYPNLEESHHRELKVARWLDSIKTDASVIIFAGDIFDFWFEYKEVIPKGFLRFYAKLVELRSMDIDLIFFTGNHDIWMFDYFEKELSASIYREPKSFQIGTQKYHIGHGDGLGPGDHKFKFFKRIFTNPLAQWAFRWLHPDVGIRLAKTWSGHTKLHEDPFLGDQEYILQYCREVEHKNHHDYYLFGHRHLILDMPVTDDARYLNMGEWINNSCYIEINPHGAKALSFEK